MKKAVVVSVIVAMMTCLFANVAYAAYGAVPEECYEQEDTIVLLHMDQFPNGNKYWYYRVYNGKITYSADGTPFYPAGTGPVFYVDPAEGYEYAYSWTLREDGTGNRSVTAGTVFKVEDFPEILEVRGIIEDLAGGYYHYEYPYEDDMPKKPTSGNLIEWVLYIGELFAYVFKMVIDAIKDFATSVLDSISALLRLAQPMFAFVAQFFASMPAPMVAAIIALVSISTALAILKLIRG